MKNKMQPKEIEEVLNSFSGTLHYYQSTVFSRLHVHTDGVHWMAEVCGAQWLISAITAWQTKINVRREPFQVWKLTVLEDRKAILTCTDGNEDSPELCRQVIEWTDFPLKEITLWQELWSMDLVNPAYVLMLPGER